MDKYEFKVKLDEINKNIEAGKLLRAAAIADEIDWSRVKSYSTLVVIINLYEEVDRLEEARNLCVIAYNKNLGGRSLLYKLTELNIRLKDFEEAEALYREYIERAPNDISRYSLRYQLEVAKGSPDEILVALLEEYKKYDQDEGCSYELACLYDKMGWVDQCIAECNELLLWFNGGEYYEDTLRLKDKYGLLTPAQKKQLEDFENARLNKFETKPVMPTQPEDISISVPDYRMYDTRNVQQEIAKNIGKMFMEEKKDAEEAKIETFFKTQTNVVAESPIEKYIDPDQVENQMDIFDWLGDAATHTVEIEPVTKTVEEVVEETAEETVEEPVETTEEIVEAVAEETKQVVEETSNEEISQEEIVEEILEVEEVAKEEAVEATEEISQELIELEEKVDDIAEEEAIEKLAEAVEEAIEEEEPMKGWIDEDHDIASTKEISDIIAKSITTLKMQKDADRVSIDLEEVSKKKTGSKKSKSSSKPVKAEPLEETVVEAVEETLDETQETVVENVTEEATAVLEETKEQVRELASVTEVQETQAEEKKSSKPDTIEIPILEDEEEEDNIEEDIKAVLEKYLSDFIEEKELKKQLADTLKNYRDRVCDNTSKTGNIIITGNQSAEKTEIALNLVKSFNAIKPDNKRKIAKISGDSLNSRGISKAMSKLAGAVLIIDNATMMDEEHIEELVATMNSDTGNMIVILIDVQEDLLKMLNTNPALDAMISNKIFVKKYSVNELVDIAKSYAYDCRCTIDDKALLQLYLRIDSIHNSDAARKDKMTREVIDVAIEKAKKRANRKIFGIAKAKQTEDVGLVLKENDFK